MILSRLWDGGVADKGAGKGADFLAGNIIIEDGINLLVLKCELCWHCRVVVVVLVAMAVRTKFSRFFLMGFC